MGDEERVNVEEIEEQEKPEEAKAAGAFETSRIIKILLYVAGAILSIFIIIGISYLVAKYVQEQRYQREQDIVLAPPPPPLAHFDMPSFSITTNDPEPHFAKITISLGYEENVELNAELVQRTPQMQHVVNILLRDKSYEELNSVEDTVNLAEEIKAHINVLLLKGKIKEVYFREFVVN
ncbi:MAG: flagellar basal body-associated FliL family protein [Spirochaetes bacterium]|nr:flagellar basal body-associated FliL family protein [Spirochaetota bacterium]